MLYAARMQARKVLVMRDYDATLRRGKFQLFGIVSADQTSIDRGRGVDATALKSNRNRAGNVLI